jgi:hypothetical protein
MKVGDEVYLSPKSEFADGAEFNPLGIKGKITAVYDRICVYWENTRTSSYQKEDLILASEYGVPAMNQGHPNASILMEIAKEAAVNPEYWKEFEVRAPNNCWYPMDGADISLIDFIRHPLRRKPRTIRIGNYDVPEPIRKMPALGAQIYAVDLDHGCVSTVSFDYIYSGWVDRGLMQNTKEGAELMLKALQELLGAKK